MLSFKVLANKFLLEKGLNDKCLQIKQKKKFHINFSVNQLIVSALRRTKYLKHLSLKQYNSTTPQNYDFQNDHEVESTTFKNSLT